MFICKTISQRRLRLPEWISTINLVLILVGYPVAASFMAVFGLESYLSQSITVPYRAFALFVSGLAIVFGITSARGIPKFSNAMKLFTLCYVLFIIRIFCDLSSDATGYANAMSFRVWGLVASAIFAAYSVYFSYRLIRFDMACLLALFFSIFVLILRPLGISSSVEELFMDMSAQRISGSSALFSIAYSYVGVVAIILSLYVIFTKYYTIPTKIIAMFLILLGLNAMLVSASRSPIVVLGFTLVAYAVTRFRNYLSLIVLSAILMVPIYIFRLALISLLEPIAPLLYARMNAMVLDGFVSGRDELFRLGLESALSSPLLGSTTIKPDDGVDTLIGYHSSIVDAFAYLGFVGGTMVLSLFICCFIYCINILRFRKFIPNYWVALVSFVYLTYSSIAGRSFYAEPLLAAFIVLAIVLNEESLKKMKIVQ